jgi:ADP-heptose:LPS heptosyltransferase
MRILVIRTSAMGDVALVAPVLVSMRTQFPDAEIIMVMRPAFKAFFTSVPGINFFFPDFNNRHKGLTGIFRLFSDLKKDGKINHIVDLHDVLRSKILRILFRISGVRSSVIDKGRKEKRDIISGKNKKQLKHSVERYFDTFRKAGFDLQPLSGPWIVPSAVTEKIESLLADKSEFLNIGFAPFAKHKLKLWPEENMLHLLHLISHTRKCRFFLFAGADEAEKLNYFLSDIPEALSVAGTLTLDEELQLMSRLDLMIAMDSSNMHMASLAGTRVVSIWGGTDPITGFGAYGQPPENFIKIQFEELSCRPCTVFGKGECHRGDFACMTWLTPEKVFKRLSNLNII